MKIVRRVNNNTFVIILHMPTSKNAMSSLAEKKSRYEKLNCRDKVDFAMMTFPLVRPRRKRYKRRLPRAMTSHASPYSQRQISTADPNSRLYCWQDDSITQVLLLMLTKWGDSTHWMEYRPHLGDQREMRPLFWPGVSFFPYTWLNMNLGGVCGHQTARSRILSKLPAFVFD